MVSEELCKLYGSNRCTFEEHYLLLCIHACSAFPAGSFLSPAATVNTLHLPCRWMRLQPDTDSGLIILDCLASNYLGIDFFALKVFYNRLYPQIIITRQPVIVCVNPGERTRSLELHATKTGFQGSTAGFQDPAQRPLEHQQISDGRRKSAKAFATVYLRFVKEHQRWAIWVFFILFSSLWHNEIKVLTFIYWAKNRYSSCWKSGVLLSFIKQFKCHNIERCLWWRLPNAWSSSPSPTEHSVCHLWGIHIIKGHIHKEWEHPLLWWCAAEVAGNLFLFNWLCLTLSHTLFELWRPGLGTLSNECRGNTMRPCFQ